MKSSRIVAPRQIEIVEVPKPKLEHGSVLVKLLLGGILGSDLHFYLDHRPYPGYPLPSGVTGHESAGIVEETDCADFRVGDRVLTCPPDSNGFVQYIVLPPQCLVPLPPDGDLGPYVVGQMLGAVLHCLRRFPSVIDMDTAILGQGSAGLIFTKMLSNMGARRIIAADLSTHRLEMATKMGATHVIDASKEDTVAAVKSITNGNMVDLVVEAVGEVETIRQAVDLVRPHGHLAMYGVPPAYELELDYRKFFRTQATCIPSNRAQLEQDLRCFKLAMDMVHRGVVDVASLITHRVPLSDMAKAYELALTRQDGAIKVLVDLQS